MSENLFKDKEIVNFEDLDAAARECVSKIAHYHNRAMDLYEELVAQEALINRAKSRSSLVGILAQAKLVAHQAGEAALKRDKWKNQLNTMGLDVFMDGPTLWTFKLEKDD